MYRLANELKKLSELDIKVSVYLNSGSKDIRTKAEIFASIEEKTHLEPEEDGFLIQANDTRFLICLEMPDTDQLKAVIVLGGNGKELSLLSNFSTNGSYKTLKTVPTYPVYGGHSTLPKDNGLRIISTVGNQLRMFEIGIASRLYVSEGSLHFLAIQELYSGQLFIDENTGTVEVPAEEFPGYANWPSLRAFVLKMVVTADLPRTINPTRHELPEITKDGEARVLFFNVSTGLGKALIKSGVAANLHWKQLDIEERFPFVETGQELIYSGTAQTKTGIQIIGVKPV